jgi:two-component system chemotaxis response regulator CheB
MTSSRRPQILIVDDSIVMRSVLRSVIGAETGLEVAATAADGESALRAVENLRPDLVLLDVEMPVMDGLATLRELRARGYKMPVIMCSSLTQRGASVTIEALAGGATDYVAKPSGQSSREAAIQTLAQELIPKIHALTVHPHALPPGATHPAPMLPLAPPFTAQPVSSIPRVLAIGVSTGGPAALDVLLSVLPADFPLPVVIVQHMPELFTKLLAKQLSLKCRLRVRESAEGDAVRAGTVYIARGNWHLEVRPASRAGFPATLHLNQGPLENHCRPSVDALFRSATAVYGAGVLAVVLTGMGSDGLIGCRIVREHGGSVLVQDQATSAVWGMPGAVAHAGLAHKVLPLNAIGLEILRMAGLTHSEVRELRESAVMQCK